MDEKKTSPFPDYFAMLNAMAGPLTQVAQAFTSRAATDAAAQAMPSLDPEEIEKKIRDLETVLVWLRAQVGAVELSVKALEMQRDFLQSLKSAPREEATQPSASSAENPADSSSSPLGQFGQFASALNPAKWAEKIMPSTPPARAKRAPRTASKPKTRKSTSRTPRS